VDEILFQVHSRIARYGISIEHVVDGSRVLWSHTVGFLDLGHPEVIVFGLDECCASSALACLLEEVRLGIFRPVGRTRQQPKLGEPGLPVRLVPVPDHYWDCTDDHRICIAAWYHEAVGRDRADLRALQLVWATKAGKFPWHAGASRLDKRRQPLLDRGLRAS
jgi:hypothetical protein